MEYSFLENDPSVTLGHAQRTARRLELMKQLDDFAKGLFVRGSCNAKSALVSNNLSYEISHKCLNQIIDIQQLKLDGRIVDRDRKVVGNVAAERSNRGVVVWPTPFAIQVRQTR